MTGSLPSMWEGAPSRDQAAVSSYSVKCHRAELQTVDLCNVAQTASLIHSHPPQRHEDAKVGKPLSRTAERGLHVRGASRSCRARATQG